MKCPKCGGEFIVQEDRYICQSCNAVFRRKTSVTTTEPTEQPAPVEQNEPRQEAAVENPENVVVNDTSVSDELKSEDLIHNEEPQAEETATPEPQSEIETLKARLAEMERKQAAMNVKVDKAYKNSISNGA